MSRTRSLSPLKAGLAVLVGATLAFSGCSTKVESKTNMATSQDSSDSAAADSGAGRRLTKTELEGALPKASDLSPDYKKGTDSSDDSSDDPMTAAMVKQCPGSKDFFEEDSKSDVSRSFETEDNRNLQFELTNQSPAEFRAANDKARAAVKGCKQVSFTDSGTKYKVSLSIHDDSSVGDDGVVLEMVVGITDKSLPRPITLKVSAKRFRVGNVAVLATAGSGFSQAAATEIPADTNIRDAVADDVANRLSTLQK